MPYSVRVQYERRLLTDQESALGFLLKEESIFLEYIATLELSLGEELQLKPDYLEAAKQWKSAAAVAKFTEVFPLSDDLEWLAQHGISCRDRDLPPAVLWNHLLLTSERIDLMRKVVSNWGRIPELPVLPLKRLFNFAVESCPQTLHDFNLTIDDFQVAAKVFNEKCRLW